MINHVIDYTRFSKLKDRIAYGLEIKWHKQEEQPERGKVTKRGKN